MAATTALQTGSGRARLLALSGLLALQGVCALFFVGDVIVDLAGLHGEVEDTRGHIGVEALVSLALVLGLGFTAHEVRGLMLRQRRLEDQLRAASGAFLSVVEAEFEAWRPHSVGA